MPFTLSVLPMVLFTNVTFTCAMKNTSLTQDLFGRLAAERGDLLDRFQIRKARDGSLDAVDGDFCVP